MDNKENKPNNKSFSIKLQNKQRECCTCNLPKSGDFQQVIRLRNSGLTIFIHKNVEVQKSTRKKSEETFILHNVGEKKLKRPDYITEMCQYKTKCLKCKTLVQKVRNMIGEIDNIKTNEVIGVCDYCKRSSGSSKCRRCEYIVSKYNSLKSKVYQNKQARFVAWLTKLNDLLRDILDVESICKHKLYQESQSILELEQLLSEFKSPLSQHKPEITYFPTTAAERLPCFGALEQNKEMLEDIMKRIKREKTRYNTYEDTSSSRSSTGCVCKYFMSKNMEGRRSMEVLPQETDYPSDLLTSRGLSKGLTSEARLRDYLDRERHGDKRSSSANYSREGTSKEMGRRSLISGRSQDSGDSRDEIRKEKGLKRDEYRRGGSKRDEYGKEKGSKVDESDRGRESKKEIPAGAKDKITGIALQKKKVGEDITREKRENNKESKSKRESSKENIPIKKPIKEGKIKGDAIKESKIKGDTIKEGKIKGDTTKEGKIREDTTKEGKIKEDTIKENKIKGDTKEGKSKADKFKEDTLKGDTTKTDKKDKSKERITKEVNKEGKSKVDKLKEDPMKRDKEDSRKIDDTKEGKGGKDKTDKEEEITKKGTQVKKDTLKENDLKKEKKGKGKTDTEESNTENKAKTTKEKRTSEIAVKKKKSSEAALFAKMMNEMRTKRDNERHGNKKEIEKEKPKQFAAIAPLPVVKKTVKSKMEVIKPEVSESVIECDECKVRQVKEVIIGKSILPFDPTIKKGDKGARHEPLLFKIMQSFPGGPPEKQKSEIEAPLDEHKSKRRPLSSSLTQVGIGEDIPGIVKYQLSNRQFIEKGWTVLPTTKILRKMNTYNMKMVNPEFDFFKRNKQKKIMFYDTGEKLAEIDSDECGKWFYKNGNIALDCYSPEEPNVKKRYVIYSSGEEKENGLFVPITILGLFDQLGNAIIYDYFGNARLKYNQTEGMIIDEKIGPQCRWKWHTLNDPPVLQPVFIDTYLKERDEDLDDFIKSQNSAKAEPSRLIKEPNIDMVMIEFENFVKDKANKLLQEFKPFQIRLKAVKINEQFSIRIVDQACVTIIFQTMPNTLRLNLGMHLINTEIVDTETAEVSEIATPYDRIPAKTESVSNIQEALNKARKYGNSIRNRAQNGSAVKSARDVSIHSNVATVGSVV